MKFKIQNPDYRLSRLRKKIHRLESELDSTTNARLSLGISLLISLGSLSIWPASPQNPLSYITLIFLISFLVAVRASLKKKRYINNLRQYFMFLERQKQRQTGHPPANPNHTFDASKLELDLPLDLDLIGDHSLLGLLDETWTSKGLIRLVTHCQSQSVEISTIREKQIDLQSLRHLTWPMLRLRMRMGATDPSQNSEDLKFYLDLPLWKARPAAVIIALFLLWVSWIGVLALANRDNPIFQWATLSFPLINLMLLKRWSQYFQALIGLTHQLESLVAGFSFIQQYQDYPGMQKLFPFAVQQSPVNSLKKLEVANIFLGTQTNPILHLVLNIIFPWSAVGALISSLTLSRANMSQSLEELPQLEVLASFLTFERFQTNTYPTLRARAFSFEELYHPLISRDSVVSNSFQFDDQIHLGLLTGSNMSGKSTFLRAIGINQLLTNMGLPVFAKSFITDAYRLQTCIHVTDSVRDGFSYFYAEVKKLSFINSLSQEGRPLLILVDELFRGTNNAERRIGSRALIQKWAKLGYSFSFVSSHDLDLAAEAQAFERVSCYHFKDDINPQTNQMHFDYKIHPGPSKTTNALKIMQLEKLVTEQDLRS